PGRVVFWVRDEGPGIELADQERIFERFARGQGARRRSDGAGLGLAIVRAVTVGHGGELRLTSRPGAGARFEIDLPAPAEERPADARPGDPVPDHTTGPPPDDPDRTQDLRLPAEEDTVVGPDDPTLVSHPVDPDPDRSA